MRGGSVKFSKKGSMQLGVEAIIILIIAIVLLGSIIYFLNQYITAGSGGVKQTLEGSIGCGRTLNPTEGTPILPEVLEVKLSKEESMELCVYNDFGKQIKEAKISIGKCLLPDLEDAQENVLKASSLPLDLDRSSTRAYEFKLSVNKAVVEPLYGGSAEDSIGEWICAVSVTGEDSVGNPASVGPAQLRVIVE